MAEQGWIEKVHNGAAKAVGSTNESPFVVRESEHMDEKRRLGAKARSILMPGCTMFLDSSTTCAQLIPHLKAASVGTVITNGIENALLLSRLGVETQLPGGTLNPKNNAIFGPSACAFLEHFSPDFLFLSTRGLSLEGELSEASDATRDAKRSMIARAKKIVLLVDASKIGKTYFAKTCDLSAVDLLITDRPLPAPLERYCSSYGIEVWIA